jgi:hypothetical protein
MQVQDISLTQIIVVLIFLGVLIVLQQLLKNNKFSFQSHLNKKKRIRFIDEFGLSNSERIRLIRVDSKGSSPTVILHEGKSLSTDSRTAEIQKLTGSSNDALRNKEQSKEKPNILSDAISNARKMNPKLGFKR